MSIIDPPRRRLVTIKAGRPTWDENAHPRDRLGRFIESGAEVRVWGGQGGRVVRNVGGGRIEIVRSDGSHAVIHRNYLTVTQRPDGSSPTTQQAADVAELPEQAGPEVPDTEQVEIPSEPTPGADTVRDRGEALAESIADPELAGQVRARSAAYEEAVTNNVPDDEADERAALLETLDTVDDLPGEDETIAALSTQVRSAATAEPVETSPEGQQGSAVTAQIAQLGDEPAALALINGTTVEGTIVGTGDGAIDVQRPDGIIDRIRESDVARVDRAAPAAEAASAAPSSPAADELPEPAARASGPASVDDVKQQLRVFADAAPSSRVAQILARNARAIARTRPTNLRLSPGGGIIARRDTSGGWVPFAVGNANRLSDPTVRFTDEEIDDALARIDALGIPFADHDAVLARWRDVSQRRKDAAALRAIGNDITAARSSSETPFAVPPGRFRDIAAVRRHLLTSPNTAVQAAASDPLASLSTSRRLLIHRDVTGQRGWRVATTHSGKRLTDRLFGTAEEAREFADLVERTAVDKDGNPYPFDGAMGDRRMNTWRNARGVSLGRVVLDAGREVQPREMQAADFADDWYQERARPEAALPNDLSTVSDDELLGLLREANRLDDRAAFERVRLENVRRAEARRAEVMSRELTPAQRLMLTTQQANGDTDLVERNLREMFGFTHTTGWTVRFDSVNPSVTTSSVGGAILDGDGNRVGTVVRSVKRRPNGEMEVHHDLLTINPQYQGQGFADAYYKALYSQYQERGIDLVTIDANIDVGGYAWAQRGFGWAGGVQPGFHIEEVVRNIDAIDTSAMSDADRARIAQFREDVRDRKFTPKQLANALSDIRWQKTLPGGTRVSMWPGKAAMLGTSWAGEFRVASLDQTPVELSDVPVSKLSDGALNEESTRLYELLGELMNEQGREEDDPDVQRITERQMAIVTERHRRIEVARNELIPGGEDVPGTDLNVGDTVIVPFITSHGPRLAQVVTRDGNEIRVRFDDGSEERYYLIGRVAEARWRRGAANSTERVAAGELKAGDKLVLDDGTRATIDRITSDGGDRILLEITDDTGQQRVIDADRAEAHLRIPGEEAPEVVRPDVADMSDDALMIEAASNEVAGASDPDHPLYIRQQEILAERNRRADAEAAVQPVEVRRVRRPTARPRLYTYQRKNLVALGLDLPDSGTSQVVQQAAARVRSRMPLTADQSQVLADHIRGLADDPGVRVRQQRSMNRLAAAFDVSAAVAAGRRADAPQPGTDRVQRIKATGLTAGDTAVLRGADGQLQTARILGAQSMMRGLLARVTYETDDGVIHARIIDRDSDVWLMPDLPPIAPTPVELRPGLELVLGEDLRAGDTITYMRGGQYLTGRIETIEDLDGELRAQTGGGHTVHITLGELRTRLERGPESADQPYLYTVQEADPETITGADVRLGDRVRVPLFDPPAQGTVISIDRVEAEGGGHGYRINFADDTGSDMSITLFDGMTVQRTATADGNASATIKQVMAERARRGRLNGVTAALDDLAAANVRSVVSRALSLAVGSGRAAVVREIERDENAGFVSASRIVNLELAFGTDVDREQARELATQFAKDAVARLLRSVREAEQLDGETEIDMLNRVLRQHMESPPRRHSREIAQTLLRNLAPLAGETSTPATPPPVPQGGMRDRMDSYRRALGGRFGHRETTRPTYGQLDFDALERGEAPSIVSRSQFERDQAEDGGPGELAMKHHEILKAAGADLDVDLQQRIETRLKSAVPSDYEGTASEYMKQLQEMSDRLAEARRRTNPWVLEISRDDPRYDEVRAEWARIGEQLRPIVDELGKFRRDYAAAQRAAAKELLSEIRQVGGVQLDYQEADTSSGRNAYAVGRGRALTERSRLVRAMRSAEEVLPTDWLTSIRAHLRTAYGRQALGLAESTRGSADYRGNIRLNNHETARYTGGVDRAAVAVHELSHFAERAVPGMLAAEEAFLWSRTSSGEIGARTREQLVNMAGIGGDSSQFGYRDDFPAPYTGVDYRQSRGRTREAYEVLTTNIESLFGGSQYMDDDSRRWLLGALALL